LLSKKITSQPRVEQRVDVRTANRVKQSDVMPEGGVISPEYVSIDL
jgi:hypothetical protein